MPTSKKPIKHNINYELRLLFIHAFIFSNINYSQAIWEKWSRQNRYTIQIIYMIIAYGSSFTGDGTNPEEVVRYARHQASQLLVKLNTGAETGLQGENNKKNYKYLCTICYCKLLASCVIKMFSKWLKILFMTVCCSINDVFQSSLLRRAHTLVPPVVLLPEKRLKFLLLQQLHPVCLVRFDVFNCVNRLHFVVISDSDVG